MKPILVPLDFSTISQKVLEYAKVISKRLKKPVTLLHAHNYKVPDLTFPKERYEEELKELVNEKRKQLEQLSNTFTKATGIPCNPLLIKGFTSDVIVEIAKKIEPELLIMGSESLSAFQRFLFDATSPEVFKKTKGKLLIVPQNASYSSFKNIAFATNFYDGDFENIDYLLQLADPKNCTLHLVHVIDKDFNPHLEQHEIESYDQKMKELYPSMHIETHMLNGMNTAKEILRFTLDKKIDLLAVAKTDKSPLEAFFSESVSKKLFLKTKVPLMVLRVDESLNDFF